MCKRHWTINQSVNEELRRSAHVNGREFFFGPQKTTTRTIIEKQQPLQLYGGDLNMISLSRLKTGVIAESMAFRFHPPKGVSLKQWQHYTTITRLRNNMSQQARLLVMGTKRSSLTGDRVVESKALPNSHIAEIAAVVGLPKRNNRSPAVPLV